MLDLQMKIHGSDEVLKKLNELREHLESVKSLIHDINNMNVSIKINNLQEDEVISDPLKSVE